MMKAWAVGDEVGTMKVVTAMRESEIRKLIAPMVLTGWIPVASATIRASEQP